MGARGGQAAAQVKEERRVEGEEGGDQPGPVLQHPHFACTTGQFNIKCRTKWLTYQSIYLATKIKFRYLRLLPPWEQNALQ